MAMNEPRRQVAVARFAGPAGLLRLIAVAAAVAVLLCGFMLAFGHLTPGQIQTWTAAGLISAGVALGIIIFV